MSHKKFEYKNVSISQVTAFNKVHKNDPGFKPYGMVEFFNWTGKEGWELCFELTKGNFVFKREIIDQPISY